MRRAYQTDLSDAEWSYIEPHLPAPEALGRPRVHPVHEVLDAIFYIVRSGCPWRSARSGRRQGRDHHQGHRRYHGDEGEVEQEEQDGAEARREAHHSPGLHQQEHSEQESNRNEQQEKQVHVGVLHRALPRT